MPDGPAIFANTIPGVTCGPGSQDSRECSDRRHHANSKIERVRQIQIAAAVAEDAVAVEMTDFLTCSPALDESEGVVAGERFREGSDIVRDAHLPKTAEGGAAHF